MQEYDSVTAEDGGYLARKWHEEVTIKIENGEYHEKLHEISNGFSEIWAIHLGHILVAKQCPYLLITETNPVLSTPYHVGSASRQFFAKKFVKMRKEEVIQLVATEWTSLIVFKPEKGGLLDFCSIVGS